MHTTLTNTHRTHTPFPGYQPEAGRGAVYPNEVASDFAFIPFGGGARKCIGDQFALFEATVAFAMLLRRFTFRWGARGARARAGLQQAGGSGGTGSPPGSNARAPPTRPLPRQRGRIPTQAASRAGGPALSPPGADRPHLLPHPQTRAPAAVARSHRLAATPEEIGMATGATIHTANGMMVNVSRRQAGGGAGSAGGQQQQPVAV